MTREEAVRRLVLLEKAPAPWVLAHEWDVREAIRALASPAASTGERESSEEMLNAIHMAHGQGQEGALQDAVTFLTANGYPSAARALAKEFKVTAAPAAPPPAEGPAQAMRASEDRGDASRDVTWRDAPSQPEATAPAPHAGEKEDGT